MLEIVGLNREQINWEQINALYSGTGEIPDLSRTKLEDGTAAIDAIRSYIFTNGCKQVQGSIVFPAGGVTKESARSVLGVTFTEKEGTFCAPYFSVDTKEYVPQGLAYYTFGTIFSTEV